MKAILYTGILASMLCISCQDEWVLEDKSPASFVSGSISYYDPLEDRVVKDFDGLSMNLSPVSSVEFDPWIKLSDSTSQYNFGPLPVGNYILEADYSSPNTHISYKIEGESIQIKSDTEAMYLDYVLEPRYNHTILCMVTDSLHNPISNAKVYLYNNYHFLEKYRANDDAATLSAKTNHKGRAVFTDLESGKYYLYVEKTLQDTSGLDTLHSYSTSFNPDSVQPLKKEELNTSTVIIQFKP